MGLNMPPLRGYSVFLCGLTINTPLLRSFSANFLLAILCAHFAWSAAAQTNFNSGSDGSYGAINITSDTTLNLPPDGIFRCTTINVASGVTLRFTKNALNTPVYLLATNDVTISGTMSLSGGDYAGGAPGLGGPGGFDGGFGGFGIGANSTGGDGFGPGAGRNADYQHGAVFAQPIQNNTNVYGNALLSPLIGGSGGAGLNGNSGYGGGGGGGAILIASNTRITVGGAIYSLGGFGYTGGGSGGAIRLVSPVVSGPGILNVNGGGVATCDGCYYSSHGSPGRLRVDCLDRYAYRSLQYNGVSTRGSQMFVFPQVVPRLNIIQAAGQVIPEGTNSYVQITLPAGSSPNQTVTVQARNFTNNVPIRVVVTPENGPSASFDAVIDVSGGNPASTVVPVVIPVGSITRIYAWTR